MVNAFQHDHATIYLPIWKIAKENDNLRKLMTEMKDYFKSANLQEHTVMSLDLSIVEKVGWPVVRFLGAILLSLNCSRPTCFQFFAPSDDIFEPSSDIINQWCQWKKGILLLLRHISINICIPTFKWYCLLIYLVTSIYLFYIYKHYFKNMT